jgi:hypothetical protein
VLPIIQRQERSWGAQSDAANQYNVCSGIPQAPVFHAAALYYVFYAVIYFYIYFVQCRFYYFDEAA